VLETSTLLFSALTACLGFFIGAYLKKRAEITALDEKQATILKHMQTQTRVTEEVKSEFESIKLELQHKSWVEQKKWEFRKDLFLELISLLVQVREHSLKADEILNKVNKLSARDLDYEEHEKQKDEIIKSAENIYEGEVSDLTEQIRVLVNIRGRLFLSNDVMTVLGKFFNSEDERRNEEIRKFERDFKEGKVSIYDQPDLSYEAYLYNHSESAKTAYFKVIDVAKADLSISG
jgi:hypothetical protein